MRQRTNATAVVQDPRILEASACHLPVTMPDSHSGNSYWIGRCPSLRNDMSPYLVCVRRAGVGWAALPAISV